MNTGLNHQLQGRVWFRLQLLVSTIFIIITGMLIISFFDRSYDDAYITFKYARNISQGLGFCYNPGSPTFGTSTPLLTLMLALLGSLGVDIPTAAGVFTCLSMLMLALTLLALSSMDGRVVAGTAAGLLILLNFRFVLTIGGESILLCLLVASAFYFGVQRDQIILASGLLGLATLTRGEGALAMPILLAMRYWRNRHIPWREGAIFVAIIGSWVIYAWSNTSSLFPGTLEAKMAQGNSGLFWGFWGKFWIWARWTMTANPVWIPLLILTIPGAISLLRRRRERSTEAQLGLLAWIVLYTVGYSVLGISGYHWYGIPIILGSLILVANSLPDDQRFTAAFRLASWTSSSMDPVSTTQTLSKTQRISSTERLTFTQRIVIILTTGLLLVFLIQETRAIKSYYHSKYFHWTLYPLAAEKLNHLTRPQESTAYLEIGHIGYYYHGRMLDLLGLTGDIDLRQVSEGNLLWGFLRMQPDYYLHWKAFDFMTEFILDEPWFNEAYELQDTVIHHDHPNIHLQVYGRKSGAALPPPLAIGLQQRKSSLASGQDEGISSIGQSFICNFDNLVRIDIKLAEAHRISSEGETLFRLLNDGPDGIELFRAILPIDWPHGAERFLPIRLGKVPAPRGQRFYFCLESPSSDQSVPPLLASTQDEYRSGARYKNGEPVNGDLVFRVWHEDPR